MSTSWVFSTTIVCAVSVVFVFLWCACHGDLLPEYVRYRHKVGCSIDLCFPENITINDYTDGEGQGRWQPDCCKNCSCDIDCYRRGDCCPDAPDAMKKFPPGGVFQCISDRLKANGRLFWDHPKRYLFVSKCDLNYARRDIKQKCELPDQYKLEQRLPVLYSNASESYRNIFCAMCNDIDTSSLIPWNVTVECIQPIPDVNSDNVNNVVLSRDDCNMLFSPPFGFHDTNVSCIEYYKNECNVSGRWQVYNKNIEDSCKRYIAPFNYVYQNIFCYICDIPNEYVQVILDVMTCSTDPPSPREFDTPSFIVLFDFRSVGDVKMMTARSTCSKKYIYDFYKAQCRLIVCSDGFTWDGDMCVMNPLAITVKDFCYSVYLRLRPVNIEIVASSPKSTRGQISVDSAIIALKQHFLEIFADHEIERLDLHYRSTVDENIGLQNNSIHALKVQYLVLHVVMGYTRNATRLFLGMDGTELLIPAVISSNISHYKQDNELTNESALVIRFIAMLIDKPFRVTVHPVNSTAHILILFTVNNTKEVLLPASFDAQQFACPAFPTKVLAHTIQCAMVALSTFYYNITRTSTALHIADFNISIKVSRVLENGNANVIRVCVDDYLNRSAQGVEGIDTQSINFSRKIITSTSSVIASYLTLSCTIISLISLTTTLTTYGLFPTLRSQPGINNICLAVSILCAQSLFLFGIRQTQNQTVCLIIGAVLHFSWLSVLCWTCICSFHMFRVFHHSQIQNRLTQSDRKTTVIYIAFSSMASLTLMAINSVYSVQSSNGSDRGYGEINGVCWLSKLIMILVTVSIPATLVSIGNICLFLIVIYQIKQSSTVHSETIRNRNYFAVYVRLSTLTGVTWLSLIPFYLTNNQVFEYIFIVLYCNQGIFIMLAFLFNRRVFTLYRTFWANRRKPASKSSTLATVLTGTRKTEHVSTDGTPSNPD